VVASLRRWGSKDAWGRVIFRLVDRLEVVDKDTFRVVLKEPYALLVNALGKPGSNLPAIMPEEVAVTPADEKVVDYVGSGPFRLVEWVPDRYVRLEAYRGYRPRREEASGFAGGKVAYVDRLDFVNIPDMTTKVGGLEAGEFDFMWGVLPEHYPRLKANPRIAVYLVRPYYWLSLVFNKARPPFSDVRARRAIQAAINPEEMMLAAIGPRDFWRLHPAIFFSDTLWSSEVGEEVYRGNAPERARALLEEMGYRGEPVVVMAPPDIPAHYNPALYLKEVLEGLGVKIDLKVYDWATIISKRVRREGWDIFFTSWGWLSNADPAQALYLDPKTPGWYESPRMEGLRMAFARSGDPKEQKRLVEDIQRLFYEELPVLKIGEYFGINAAGTYVRGCLDTPTDPVFWNVWLAR
jgi:peptide/nickel transport system substrate-binding protein